MKTKVLILMRGKREIKELTESLKYLEIAVIGALEAEEAIPFGKLAARYNIIVIDKHFCFHARETSKLVRKIRKEFFNPMIATSVCPGSGEVFSLQVAGCNFIEYSTSLEKICNTVCECVLQISAEWSQQQKQG